MNFLLFGCFVSVSAQDWNLGQKIVASDRAAFDVYGWSVDISGTTAVVGAYAHDADSSGSNPMPDAGLVYFYEYDSLTGWQETQRVNASDRDTNGWFGRVVKIYGDRCIVGTPTEDEDSLGLNPLSNAGAVYILERNTFGKWFEVQKIVPSDRDASENFGNSVAMSGDYLIATAPGDDTDSLGGNFIAWTGAAFVFKRNSSGRWIQKQKIHSPVRTIIDQFGTEVDMTDGWALIGATQEDHDVNETNYIDKAGAAYFFKQNSSGRFVFRQKVVANVRDTEAFFGGCLAINGATAIISAPYEDFDSLGSNYVENAGAAYIFQRNGSNVWQFQQKINGKHRGVNHVFGESVDLEGNRLIAGQGDDFDFNGGNFLPGAGSINYFEKNSAGEWIQREKFIARDRISGNQFGRSVGMSGEAIIGGAQFQSFDEHGNNFVSTAGAAYIYQPCFTMKTNDTLNICEGDSIDIFGEFRDTIGTYIDTFLTYLGCDSISNIRLEHDPVYQTNLSPVTICTGDSISLFGTYQSNSGTYYQTLTSEKGCDSVLAVNLSLYPIYNTSIPDVETCQGDSVMIFGNYESQAGIYYDSLSTTDGCDSVITQGLIVNSDFSGVPVNEGICPEDSLLIFGSYQSAPGIYYDSLNTSKGCDSILVTILNHHMDYHISDSAEICTGDTFSFAGNHFTTAGMHQVNFQTTHGCDSNFTIDLDIVVIDSSITFSQDTLYSNELSGDGYQWYYRENDSAAIVPLGGETNRWIDVSSEARGWYRCEITKKACMSLTDAYWWKPVGIERIANFGELKIFPNPSDGRFRIELSGSLDEMTFRVRNLQGQEVPVEVERSSGFVELIIGASPGVYLLEVTRGEFNSVERLVISES